MKNLFINFLLVLCCCHLPKKTWADSFKIISTGDSLTYATFSKSEGFKPEKDMPVVGIKSAPRDISWIQKILFKLTAFPEYSFVCGTKIDSHFKKMKRLIGDVVCESVALPGDRAIDLSSFQCPKAAAMNGQYVTIEIGLNDIFHGENPSEFTSAKEYEFHIRKCIDQLRLNNDPYIVLVPLPDLSNIRDLIGEKRTVWYLKAKDVWNIAKFAPVVTDGNFKSEVQNQIAEYNKVLERLSKEYGKKVYFNNKCANMKLKPEYISRIDALHSSSKGHQAISDCSFPF